MPILIQIEKEKKDEKENFLRSVRLSKDEQTIRKFSWLSFDAIYHDSAHLIGTGERYVIQNHASYRVCKCAFAENIREREKKLSDDIRLSGTLKNMTHDEFMRIHNMTRKEFMAEVFPIISNWIFCEDKPAVLTDDAKLPLEDLQDRIWALEQFKDLLSVHISKEKVTFLNEEEQLDETRRETLRKRDKDYDKARKARLDEETIKNRAKELDKVREKLKKLGLSTAQVESEIAKIEQKSKLEQKKPSLNAEEKFKAKLKALGMTDEEVEKFWIEKRTQK